MKTGASPYRATLGVPGITQGPRLTCPSSLAVAHAVGLGPFLTLSTSSKSANFPVWDTSELWGGTMGLACCLAPLPA